MRYFKPLIISLILLLFSQTCYAEQWETLKREHTKKISIDIDSVNYHNDSLYYLVYYDILLSANSYSRDKKYAVVQSKGNSVGIVETSNYNINLNPLTHKVATNFKTLTQDSLLYEANQRAQEVYEWSKKTPNTKDMPYLKSYMKFVNQRIKMRWEPPRRTITGQAVVNFKIAKNGRLLGCNIVQSSGDSEFDYQACKAIENAGFNPLPEQYRGASIEINYTFTAN